MSSSASPQSSLFTVRVAEPRDAGAISRLTVLLAEETEGVRLDAATVSRGVEWALSGRQSEAAHTEENAEDHQSRSFYDFGVQYWVAEDAATRDVVAHVGVSPEWSDWWATTYWWVVAAYVSRSHRRLGIAKALFEAMANAADRDRVQTINLRVDKANVNAQRFYASLGFAIDDSHLVMSRGRRSDGTPIISDDRNGDSDPESPPPPRVVVVKWVDVIAFVRARAFLLSGQGVPQYVASCGACLVLGLAAGALLGSRSTTPWGGLLRGKR